MSKSNPNPTPEASPVLSYPALRKRSRPPREDDEPKCPRSRPPPEDDEPKCTRSRPPPEVDEPKCTHKDGRRDGRQCRRCRCNIKRREERRKARELRENMTKEDDEGQEEQDLQNDENRQVCQVLSHHQSGREKFKPKAGADVSLSNIRVGSDGRPHAELENENSGPSSFLVEHMKVAARAAMAPHLPSSWGWLSCIYPNFPADTHYIDAARRTIGQFYFNSSGTFIGDKIMYPWRDGHNTGWILRLKGESCCAHSTCFALMSAANLSYNGTDRLHLQAIPTLDIQREFAEAPFSMAFQDLLREEDRKDLGWGEEQTYRSFAVFLKMSLGSVEDGHALVRIGLVDEEGWRIQKRTDARAGLIPAVDLGRGEWRVTIVGTELCF